MGRSPDPIVGDTMKRAFIFAGQGAQKTGMGLDFYQKDPHFKAFIDTIKQTTSFDYPAMVFAENPHLHDTHIAQGALCVFSEGVRQAFAREGLFPDAVAGLSLGEYNALIASGSTDFETLFPIVLKRSNAMQKATESIQTGMMALRLSYAEVEALIAPIPDLYIANHNSVSQVVVGGTFEALESVQRALKEAGLKKGIPLKTSGAFHTPFMSEALPAIERAFASMTLYPTRIPLYQNLNGQKTDQPTAQQYSDHCIQPVRFMTMIESMIHDGITHFIEIGPGGILKKLIQAISSEAHVDSVATWEDFHKVISQEKGATS